MPSISDEIRLALDKPDGVSEEIMMPLAAQYDQQVTAVNERLDEAVMLLRKNLRSEAIQSANRRPNVIDAAASLDFPEVAEWFEILQFLGVKLPRRLDLEKIQQINEAIVEEQPIEELLRQHRRLAIARAPLNWRLSVLRRIADSDPMNPAWMDDIESYERERLKTLRSDVESALKANDLNAIHHLFSELTKQSWVTEVPGDLAGSLQKAIKQNEYDAQVEGLRRVSADLHEAFSGFDEAAARRLLADWNTKCGALKGPVPVDLQQEVTPTITWLEELDQYAVISQQRDAALEKLETALDRERDPSKLHKAHAAAARFDEPIPVGLEQRYRALQDQIALNAKRKTQLKLGSVIAATILVAILIGAWQLRSMRAAKVADTTASFKKLVDAKRTAEAQAFWEKTQAMDESLTQQPGMVEAKERLDAQVNQEKERVREFENYLSKADSEEPATIDPKSLDEAERLAKTEDEKAKVFAIREKLDKYLKGLSLEHTTKALEEVDRARKRLAEMEKLDYENLDIDELDELIVGLTELSRLYPRRSGEVDAQVRLVQTKAENIDDAFQEYRRAEMVRQQARRPLEQAKTIEAYQSALERYSRVIQNATIASELSRALSESSLWGKGMATNDLAGNTAKMVANGLQPEEIEQLVTSVNGVKSSSAVNPLLGEFEEAAKLIDSAAESQADALEVLEQKLDRLPYSDLVTVLADDARDDLDGTALAYLVYIDDYQRALGNLEDQSGGTMGLKRVGNVNGGITSSIINTPMSRAHVEPGQTMKWLVKELEDRSDDLQTAFDKTLVRLARELTKRGDLDHRIKEQFLDLILRCAVDGSVVMKERLGAASDYLSSREDQRRLWFNPMPPNDQLALEVVQAVTPALDSADEDLPDAESLLLDCSAKRYVFCGFIDRAEDGAVQPVLHQNAVDGTTCYVMVAAVTDPTKVAITPIGKWMDGKLGLDLTSVDVLSGRPLFYIRD